MLSTGHGKEWNGRRFFHIPYWQFSSILKIFHYIFHSILKFSSIFHSILPYQRNFRLEAMQRIFCCFASLNVVSNRSWRCVNNIKMQQPVSGMHIAHGLMYRRSQDFGLGEGLNRKSHAITSSEIFEKRDFLWDKEWKIKSWRSDLARNQDLLKGKDQNCKLKSFTYISKLGDVVSKLVQFKRVTDRPEVGATSRRRLWESGGEALSR